MEFGLTSGARSYFASAFWFAGSEGGSVICLHSETLVDDRALAVSYEGQLYSEACKTSVSSSVPFPSPRDALGRVSQASDAADPL